MKRTVCIFLTFVVISGCGKEFNIDYEVESSTEIVAVTYTKSGGNMSDTETVSTPWSGGVETNYDGNIFLTVQFIEGRYSSGDKATARIIVNGEECASDRGAPPAFQVGCTFDSGDSD